MKHPEFSADFIEALSIDCTIFGFHNGQLHILLVRHAEGISAGKWALPGGWIRYNESIDQSAARVLRDLTGMENIFMEQLRAFGDLERYPGKRVITIAYFALVKSHDYHLSPGFTASEVDWFTLDEIPDMPYDHNEILKVSLAHLRLQVRHEPIGFNLLPKKFTLLQLQELYESILRVKLDKPNFRRKIMRMNLLVPSSEKQKDVSHRAAKLYRFDKKVYDRLLTQGFNFEF